jgi:Zn finger protein HypA/HybF involved in hydrogenase expression
MDALDGNALAGPLYDAFETEMTTVTGTCRSCRAPSLIAELQVYVRAPGTVARCPHCGAVMLVVVESGGATRAHLDGVDLLS